MKLSKNKLADFENYFLQRQKDILKTSEARASETIDVGGDEIDIVQNNIIKNLSDQLSNREKVALRKIEHCLSKIKEGTFGICEECAESIGDARLKALPDTILCISCAEEQEINKTKGL